MTGGDLGFSFAITRDGTVRVSRDGRLVSVIAGAPARRFIARVDSLDEAATQLALARLTGNYRRGNERQ